MENLSVIKKYRVINWFDKKSGKTFYGIDALLHGIWYHVKEDEPLFFADKKEAVKKKKELTEQLSK